MAASFSPGPVDEPEAPSFDKYDIYQTVPSTLPWEKLKEILDAEKSPKKKKVTQQPRLLFHKKFMGTNEQLGMFGTFLEFKPPPPKGPRIFKIEEVMEPYFLDGSVAKVEENANVEAKESITGQEGKKSPQPMQQNPPVCNSTGMSGPFIPVYAPQWRSPWPVPVCPVPMPQHAQK